MDESSENRLPSYWLAIDPGDQNVGFTEWMGDQCQAAWHLSPDESVQRVEQLIAYGKLELLVHERFALYPGAEQGRGQMGSEFLTPQLIGVYKYLCRKAGVPVVSHLASHHKNYVKKAEFRPPAMPLRAWKSYGQGPHAKDAESLGYYHVRTVKMKGKGY